MHSGVQHRHTQTQIYSLASHHTHAYRIAGLIHITSVVARTGSRSKLCFWARGMGLATALPPHVRQQKEALQPLLRSSCTPNQKHCRRPWRSGSTNRRMRIDKLCTYLCCGGGSSRQQPAGRRPAGACRCVRCGAVFPCLTPQLLRPALTGAGADYYHYPTEDARLRCCAASSSNSPPDHPRPG